MSNKLVCDSYTCKWRTMFISMCACRTLGCYVRPVSSSCMLHQTPFRIFKELNAKYCHTFFLSQEFQSGDPGIPVSKLDSICPGKTWELLQIRKTKTCVQENSSCLLVWHRRLCMATFFFTRTRLKTFFFNIFTVFPVALRLNF